MEKRGYRKLRNEALRSQSVENSLWRRLWTCPMAEKRMNEYASGSASKFTLLMNERQYSGRRNWQYTMKVCASNPV
jgi:hypothetical protein